MRLAGLASGSLTDHCPRQLALLRSVQGARPLRRSAAIPPDAVMSSLSLLVMRSMEPRRQACSTGRKAASPGVGGTPTSAWGYRKRYPHALLAYAIT